MSNTRKILLVAISLMATFFSAAMMASDADAAYVIAFPVIGKASYSNDFYATRNLRGRTVQHNATDIIAKKGQQLIAAASGTIIDVQYPEPDWGFSVSIRDRNGFEYTYIHMNNDNWGTNNNIGGPMRAYAADMKVGNTVQQGQLLGYVGDSGFAGSIPHLHFEMKNPSGEIVNPYNYLIHSKRLSKPVLYQPLSYELLSYGRSFKGGASIEGADFDPDAQSEFVIGSGPGMVTNVRTYDDTNHQISNIRPYATSFRGGVQVATGDVDNDGVDEIITGPGKNGKPLVKIYELNGTLKSRFYAYDYHWVKGGVAVAACDVDNDGFDEIITGPGPGAAPRIKVFELNGVQKSDFYAYHQSIKYGVDISCGDVVGSVTPDIVVSPLNGGTPHVKVFNSTGTVLSSFYAYSKQFLGGVKLSVGDVRSEVLRDEIVVVPATYAAQHTKIWTGNGSYLKGQKFLEVWWVGFHDVAALNDGSKTTTGGNRRTSVRDAIE